MKEGPRNALVSFSFRNLGSVGACAMFCVSWGGEAVRRGLARGTRETQRSCGAGRRSERAASAATRPGMTSGVW